MERQKRWKNKKSKPSASENNSNLKAQKKKGNFNKSDETNDLTCDKPAEKKQQIVKEMSCYDEQGSNKISEDNESLITSFASSSVHREPIKSHMRNNIIPNKNFDKFHDFYNCNTRSDSEASSLKVSESYTKDVPNLIRCDLSVSGRSVGLFHEISCNSSVSDIEQPKIVIAEHIIVANVPVDYSIHFILHLFHKFDPIAGSLMKKIHGTGIRYCHVYFGNRQNALEVEQRFDNYALNCKRLIVMRSQSLLKECMMGQ